MNTTPSAHGDSRAPAATGIRRSQQIGDVLATGVVTGCSTDIQLQLESPYRIKISSNHIPGFALKVKQWMRGTSMTDVGEREVVRLFGVAVALGDAVQAHRAQLLDALAEHEREALPFQQSIDAARENLTSVRRERRDAVRNGGTHEPDWQNVVLKPAKVRLAQAEACLDHAGQEFEAQLAGILGFADRLPGCISWREIRQLLA